MESHCNNIDTQNVDTKNVQSQINNVNSQFVKIKLQKIILIMSTFRMLKVKFTICQNQSIQSHLDNVGNHNVDSQINNVNSQFVEIERWKVTFRMSSFKI